MADSAATLSHVLTRLREPIREALSIAPYAPPDGPVISVKANLLSLIPPKPTENIRTEIRDFCLCCAALASAAAANDTLSWIPGELSESATVAVSELAEAVYCASYGDELIGAGNSDSDFSSAPKESRLAALLMPDVLPLLKGVMKESSIGSDDDEFSAASARAPVAEAVVAAHQLRWFVTQESFNSLGWDGTLLPNVCSLKVEYPYLGKLCSMVLPCVLTALDHWSPGVKGQGILSLIHLAKNVNAAELGFYEEVLLDECCRNIVSVDELWHHVVEMSVLLYGIWIQNAMFVLF
ncbi:hypothetical protein ACLOJK_009304 [Asimina triloba]